MLAAALLGGVLAGASLAAQQAVFRDAVDIVRVYVTVIDGNDRLVTTLTRDEFEVRDRGRPQPIVLFDNTPQPIQLIVMLDVSGSMHGNLPLLRTASRELFARLGPDDVARVGSFGRDISISPSFTADVASLLEELPASIEANAPTPLWRAIDEAIGAFDAASHRRRVVLVLSDGKDSPPLTFSRPVDQVHVMDRARDEDVMIYAVGMHSRGPVRPRPGIGAGGLQLMLSADQPDPGLARVALETGGGYLEIRFSDDLAAAFSHVIDELHSQYMLGFVPPARDGRVHQIDVRVSARGLKPRARKAYVAPRDR